MLLNDMNGIFKYGYIFATCMIVASSYLYAEDYSEIHFLHKIAEIPIKTWEDLRNSDIEKQDNDSSCGAASMATILRFFYHKDIHENDIIRELINLGIYGGSTFYELKKVANKFGFKAVGSKLSFKKLKSIIMPAIVHLHYQNQNHFAVIRGINEQGIVWLGDPSLGNIYLSEEKFRSMWEIRNDPILKGGMLLILPEDKSSLEEANQNFFKSPVVNTTTAIKLINLDIL